MRNALVILLGAALLGAGATGCGSPVPEPGVAPAPGDGLVVRLTSLPGLGPVTGSATSTPAYALYGDGRLIENRSVAARIDADLVLTRVSRHTVRDLLRAATKALLLPEAQQRRLGAGVLDITVLTTGGRFGRQVAGVGPVAADLLGTFASAVAPGRDRYEPTAVAVIGFPAGSAAGPAGTWPLTGMRRAAFGPGGVGWCALLLGADLDRVRAVAGAQSGFSVWSVDGERFSVVFRPLLPDDTDCGSLTR